MAIAEERSRSKPNQLDSADIVILQLVLDLREGGISAERLRRLSSILVEVFEDAGVLYDRLERADLESIKRERELRAIGKKIRTPLRRDLDGRTTNNDERGLRNEPNVA